MTFSIKRSVKDKVLADLEKKMVFLVGPRQSGKTWLAKEILKEFSDSLYLNYDSIEDRRRILKFDWLPQTKLIVFDELHKMKKWKNYIKGVFDTKPVNMRILVTGSARLEVFRKAGDSLAGRFFVHHLHPFTLQELNGQDTISNGNSMVSLKQNKDNEQFSANTKIVDRLTERGGFPEPFLIESGEGADRWRNTYIDSMMREDILEFSDIEKVKAMRDIFEILRTKVGAPLSYTNIAQDVGLSVKTVKKYIEVLKSLYIIFTISPFTKKISKSIIKEPKVYFYDLGLIKGDDGVIFENLVALELIAYAARQHDSHGKNISIAYLKNKQKKEVDFAIVKDDQVSLMVEVKHTDTDISPGMMYFSDKYALSGMQVVKYIRHERVVGERVQIVGVERFLERLSKA